MKRRMGLRRRLAVGLTLTLVALWGIASFLALDKLRHEAGEVFDAALEEVAQRVLPLAYAQLVAADPADDADQVVPSVSGRTNISYTVRDGSGRILLRSDDAGATAIPVTTKPGFATIGPYRTFTVVGVKGSVIVTAAESIIHRRAAMRSAVAALILPLVGLVIAAAIGIGVIVRLALAPLLAFGHALESRGRGNLTPVDSSDVPTEFLPVATAVNALIERLNNALAAERAFTANSAHELRTPVAAALAQAQRLHAELAEDPRSERAARLVSSLRRLTRLSEKLLQLAKAEGASVRTEKSVPLGPILRFVVDEIVERHACEERLRLTVDDSFAPTPGIDPDAFAVLVRNLVENALKHGAEDGIVEVELSSRALRVVNDGDIVPPETLARVTRPFERGATGAEGSGLGLAIAAAVCRGGGMRLVLSSPAPGRAGGFHAEAVFNAGFES